ncbi:C-type lectin-2 [Aphelenchoides avenae]|nr:C-type lectin-2 [Aphelenchus avenae]
MKPLTVFAFFAVAVGLEEHNETAQRDQTAGDCSHCVCPSCPSGWTYYRPTGKCYQAVCNVTATAASGQCQELGATLMSAHNLDDNNWIYQFGTSSCPYIGYWTGSMWVGVFDVQFSQNWTDYNWQWADGSAVDFTNWNQDQPNGKGSGRCASINGREDAFGPDTTWDDSDCSLQMQAAVCQMNPK